MSKANGSHDVGGGEKEGGDVDVHLLLEMSGVFSRLVPDIFLNIISRVPLKSLSQCRWVCKSWYKLIKTPSFASIQYEWAIKNNSPWFLFWTHNKDLCLVDDQVFDNLETSATTHDLELKEFKQAFDLLIVFQRAGYVNGLLCLADPWIATHPSCYRQSSIYICNPITGEDITIPKSPKYKTSAITAFGFDPITNEYKVIRLIHYVDKDGECLSSEGEVYTLGSSEWRKIEDVPHITDGQRCGVLLNGNLHWISYVSDSPIIIAFNVGSEKFDVIQPPSHMFQINHIYKRLVVVEGHMCFVYQDLGSPCEIWMMKDYGIQSSWVKRYSFNSYVSKWFWYGSHDLITLRNGEFFLPFEESKNNFMGYLDPKTDTLRPIRITRHGENQHLDYYFRSVMQVGSLFSPKDVGKSRRGRKV